MIDRGYEIPAHVASPLGADDGFSARSAIVTSTKRQILAILDYDTAVSVKFTIKNDAENAWPVNPHLIDISRRNKICVPTVIHKLLEPTQSLDLNIQLKVPTHLLDANEPYTECDFRLQNPETGKYFGEELSALIILQKGFQVPKTEHNMQSIMDEAQKESSEE
jgi:hypothetical protein